ncbi:hypothetical protein ACJ72_07742 [Emergomyces africanus]|uniref:Uncharacterized protein n=1 Tax=Emergomyces africanus TaxID=1955775 RepID=A0A1B7NMA3_9EURO|nr:hypothetical protein ACJ72_07742 [Emergomyces africanus]
MSEEETAKLTPQAGPGRGVDCPQSRMIGMKRIRRTGKIYENSPAKARLDKRKTRIKSKKENKKYKMASQEKIGRLIQGSKERCNAPEGGPEKSD